MRFRPGTHSPPSMRRVFKEGWDPARRKLGRRDQDSVWAEVRRKHGTLKVSSKTEDMAATIEAHREKVERMQKLCVYPAPANGIALTFGGELVCIDLLDKASSLEKIWSRFQEGLLIDLLERKRPEREITAAEIAARLDHMHRLPWHQVEPVGSGRAVSRPRRLHARRCPRFERDAGPRQCIDAVSPVMSAVLPKLYVVG